MLFSKCYSLEVKNVVHFKVCHEREERLNYGIISNKQKFRKQSFLGGFHASENENKRK